MEGKRHFSFEAGSFELEVRNRVLSQQRSNSSANIPRPTLARLFIGAPNANSSNYLQPPSPAPLSPPLNSPAFFRRNKFSLPIPADSRAFEYPEFCDTSEAEDDLNAHTDLYQLYLALGGGDKLHRRNSKCVTRKSFSASSSNAQIGMRKVMRVVVVGPKHVGKTAILLQLARFHDITGQPYIPTIDDTYQIQLDATNERPKEIVIFHDTAGLPDHGPFELKKQYIQVADAFLLVYSLIDADSFNRMDLLKRYICSQFGKDKKEVPIVVVGTCADLPGRQIDSNSTALWAAREKVKLFEISTRDRLSIVEVIHFLASKYLYPMKEAKFSITKRLKPEKTNAQIVMDF